MLASLLINEPQGGAPGKIYGAKYLMCEGIMRDVQRDKPEAALIKEVIHALYKIKIPEETRLEVDEIIAPYAAAEETCEEAEATRYDLLAADYAAYCRLVDILTAYAREEEETALIMVILGAV